MARTPSVIHQLDGGGQRFPPTRRPLPPRTQTARLSSEVPALPGYSTTLPMDESG
eukprot:CAMPEP_0185529896 /NCGR_PEP_ID=MMETSP1366-20130426/102592_1 /TAXON_ID=38817 /ORGANISM="Gephyrocapsa oceanica, Strain RCC1303" /LENGTH=54 /DNA_ID=CAMNT_0028141525 /DNA_START=95 /DNA_END=256 /DNA_ORIENTATION=+